MQFFICDCTVEPAETLSLTGSIMSAAGNSIAAIILPESVVYWVCAVIRAPGKRLTLLLEI